MATDQHGIAVSLNRAAIRLCKLGSDPQLAIQRRGLPLPAHATALADVISPERGWLLRMQHTNTLAIWLAGGGLRSVDQRKANAALARLESE